MEVCRIGRDGLLVAFGFQEKKNKSKCKVQKAKRRMDAGRMGVSTTGREWSIATGSAMGYK
jgi:hypothetical protein